MIQFSFSSSEDGRTTFKVNDSVTGALLAAGIDKRVGQKRVLDSFDSWSDIDDAIAFWAQQARFRLCRLRVDTNCAEPKSRKILSLRRGLLVPGRTPSLAIP